jgi:hypothetical protein
VREVKKRRKIRVPARLCLDFGTKADMLSYIRAMNMRADSADKMVAAYPLDAIDVERINQGHTYILKHKGDRPDELEVK